MTATINNSRIDVQVEATSAAAARAAAVEQYATTYDNIVAGSVARSYMVELIVSDNAPTDKIGNPLAVGTPVLFASQNEAIRIGVVTDLLASGSVNVKASDTGYSNRRESQNLIALPASLDVENAPEASISNALALA